MTRDLIDVRSQPLFPLVKRAFDGVAVLLPGPWRLAYVNHALAEWAGALPDELVGREVEELVATSCGSSLNNSLHIVFSRQQDEETVAAELLTRPQQRISVEIRIVRLELDNVPSLALLIRRPPDAPHDGAPILAERRDPLTELPDRAFLLSHLASLLRRSRTGGRRFAVLFVDLDNFKEINDANGHLVGDNVLREVARRLNAGVRDGDCVVRYGGDEFVVIVDQVDGIEEVQPVIHRLHAALTEPISLPSGEAILTASIGAAIASPDVSTPEDLLMAADRAMYASKQSRLGERSV